MIKNTTDDKIALENINIRYFSSQPPCSDKPAKENTAKNYEAGVLKKSQMKNPFEDTLFRIEDERFEIDINIERFRAMIKWLDRLEEPNVQPARAAFLIDKIKKFQVVELIYGPKQEEMIKGIEAYGGPVIQVLKKRVQEKLEVLQDSKQKYEGENWSPSLEASFHRSLDQNSVSIKYFDKKVLVNKSSPASPQTSSQSWSSERTASTTSSGERSTSFTWQTTRPPPNNPAPTRASRRPRSARSCLTRSKRCCCRTTLSSASRATSGATPTKTRSSK